MVIVLHYRIKNKVYMSVFVKQQYLHKLKPDASDIIVF